MIQNKTNPKKTLKILILFLTITKTFTKTQCDIIESPKNCKTDSNCLGARKCSQNSCTGISNCPKPQKNNPKNAQFPFTQKKNPKIQNSARKSVGSSSGGSSGGSASDSASGSGSGTGSGSSTGNNDSSVGTGTGSGDNDSSSGGFGNPGSTRPGTSSNQTGNREEGVWFLEGICFGFWVFFYLI